ncbi:hypothetical protein D9M71_714590 [compost metagenome]
MAFRLGQAAGDLVEQQQAWPGGERAGHLQTLAFQQSERAGQGVGLAYQPGDFQDMGAPLGRALFVLVTTERRAHQ